MIVPACWNCVPIGLPVPVQEAAERHFPDAAGEVADAAGGYRHVKVGVRGKRGDAHVCAVGMDRSRRIRRPVDACKHRLRHADMVGEQHVAERVEAAFVEAPLADLALSRCSRSRSDPRSSPRTFRQSAGSVSAKC